MPEHYQQRLSSRQTPFSQPDPDSPDSEGALNYHWPLAAFTSTQGSRLSTPRSNRRIDASRSPSAASLVYPGFGSIISRPDAPFHQLRRVVRLALINTLAQSQFHIDRCDICLIDIIPSGPGKLQAPRDQTAQTQAQIATRRLGPTTGNPCRHYPGRQQNLVAGLQLTYQRLVCRLAQSSQFSGPRLVSDRRNGR